MVLDTDEVPRTYEDRLRLRVNARRAVSSANRHVPVDIIVYTRPEYEELMKNMGSFLKERLEADAKEMAEGTAGMLTISLNTAREVRNAMTQLNNAGRLNSTQVDVLNFIQNWMTEQAQRGGS